MKLSVIIVNYNVKYFLEQCLLSVRAASRNLAVEVIVIDNNSVDGSEKMMAEKFSEVRYIFNKKNVGFSKANNQGIEIAQGEYVLLLNPDTVVEETTFDLVVDFMDKHPDVGGLGVKMIDGKGNFLPESKRALPRPNVAFYKIFGLSNLFPKSKRFGHYHLGYLDEDETHEVDILSGAFMLLRAEALKKVGLLDEDFFMYGEDIDLSHRITLGGYKNYYFPKTRIIHYKGESTKKSSINYVFVFYNAMIIFARKHFTESNATLFSFLINMAIYFRAFIAILTRFLEKSFWLAVDFTFILIGLNIQKLFYVEITGKILDESVVSIALPVYSLTWVLSIYLNGGYDQPIRIKKVVAGSLIGTALILATYALLDNDYRFSRALVLTGMAWAISITVLLRVFLHFLPLKNFKLGKKAPKRLAIVGSAEEIERVKGLLKQTVIETGFIAYINARDEPEDGKSPFLTTIGRLREAIDIFKLDEIIFCAKDVSARNIIDQMSLLGNTDLDYKIAPADSQYIIGSNSINAPGELYSIMNINSISSVAQVRNKRILDILVSIILLLLYPVACLGVREKGRFLLNIFSVLFGQKTWVAYVRFAEDSALLPTLKKGILHPLDRLPAKNNDKETAHRENLAYAKNYAWWHDLNIIYKGYSSLGRH